MAHHRLVDIAGDGDDHKVGFGPGHERIGVLESIGPRQRRELLAMIGAIVLTLRHKPYVKRQNIAEQNARDPKEAIEIVDVKPGQGI